MALLPTGCAKALRCAAWRPLKSSSSSLSLHTSAGQGIPAALLCRPTASLEAKASLAGKGGAVALAFRHGGLGKVPWFSFGLAVGGGPFAFAAKKAAFRFPLLAVASAKALSFFATQRCHPVCVPGWIRKKDHR